jgi:hypothetical protein
VCWAAESLVEIDIVIIVEALSDCFDFGTDTEWHGSGV